MVELALIVLTHLKDQRVEPLSHPTNRDVLQRQVISNFQVVRARQNLLRFFKPDPSFRVLPQSLALGRIKMEAHSESITVIPSRFASISENPHVPSRTLAPSHTSQSCRGTYRCTNPAQIRRDRHSATVRRQRHFRQSSGPERHPPTPAKHTPARGHSRKTARSCSGSASVPSARNSHARSSVVQRR